MDGYDVREMLSRRFYIGSDSTEISIGGIIEPIKRSIHEMPIPQILLSMSEGNDLNTSSILVKVRPEAVDGFKSISSEVHGRVRATSISAILPKSTRSATTNAPRRAPKSATTSR